MLSNWSESLQSILINLLKNNSFPNIDSVRERSRLGISFSSVCTLESGFTTTKSVAAFVSSTTFYSSFICCSLTFCSSMDLFNFEADVSFSLINAKDSPFCFNFFVVSFLPSSSSSLLIALSLCCILLCGFVTYLFIVFESSPDAKSSLFKAARLAYGFDGAKFLGCSWSTLGERDWVRSESSAPASDDTTSCEYYSLSSFLSRCSSGTWPAASARTPPRAGDYV